MWMGVVELFHYGDLQLVPILIDHVYARSELDTTKNGTSQTAGASGPSTFIDRPFSRIKFPNLEGKNMCHGFWDP